jgi:hypothetical protein
VLISEHLGDFSSLVQEEDLGVVVQDGVAIGPLKRTDEMERERLGNFAQRHLTKNAFNAAYVRLLAALSGPVVRP